MRWSSDVGVARRRKRRILATKALEGARLDERTHDGRASRNAREMVVRTRRLDEDESRDGRWHNASCDDGNAVAVGAPTFYPQQALVRVTGTKNCVREPK
jgi:hypothetical protein